MARIIELILTEEKTVGKGVDGDPIRKIVQLFNKDGQLVLEYDHHSEKAPETMFIRENLPE